MKLAWLLVIVVGCGSGKDGERAAPAASGDQRPASDRVAWGRELLAALERLEPAATLGFDDRAFEITYEDSESRGVVPLGNYFEEARRDKSSVEDVAARIHRSRSATAASGVLPSLRERVVIEVDANLRARRDPKIHSSDSPADTVPYQPVGDELALGLVEDRAETITWITTKALVPYGGSFDPLLASATRQLLARKAPAMTTIRPGSYRFDGDEYGATHVVLGRLDRGLEVQGDPIALFSSRETVFVTGSKDVEGVEAILAAAEVEAAKPRAWIPRLLRATANGWEPVTGLPAFLEVQRTAQVADYERQTELLRELAQDGGTSDEDAFTAKVVGMENKALGRIITMATLTQTVDTLLPQVDLVDLALWENEAARHIGLVTFSSLQATLGTRMVKTSLWPPRYRISSFPTAAEIKKLGPKMSFKDFP
ncbi:MAG: hypothetical protein JWP01_1967 [Myxococcales bacterium]|nr:hypothetical protein [Myxococcales bacterium]